jgi:hypothetical protein
MGTLVAGIKSGCVESRKGASSIVGVKIRRAKIAIGAAKVRLAHLVRFGFVQPIQK